MEDFERAADILLDGGTVIFPTDTVLGLGAIASSDAAVKKLYQIKKRDRKKPISVLIADFEDILKVAEIPSREEGRLMEKFWPGPLTLILKKKPGVLDVAAAGGDTIGVRMPKSLVVRNLIREVGFPLATTSVNLSGNDPAKNFDQIDEKILEKIDFVLENDEKSSNLASTVVKIVGGAPEILREGDIKKSDIEAALK